RTRRAARDAPARGENQASMVEGGAVAPLLGGEAGIARRAVAAGRARCLSLADPAEERLDGFLEPGQHLLEHVRMETRVRAHRGAEGLHLGLLAGARAGDAASIVGGLARLHCGRECAAARA